MNTISIEQSGAFVESANLTAGEFIPIGSPAYERAQNRTEARAGNEEELNGGNRFIER